MLEQYDLKDILFFDIETVPQEKSFDDVNDSLKELWDKKSKYFRKEDESPADVYQRAGIYAEFGKIVCISVGLIRMVDGNKTIKLKSYADIDEKALLTSFGDMLQGYSPDRSSLEAELEVLKQLKEKKEKAKDDIGDLSKKIKEINNKIKNYRSRYLCGHNIKEFDVPYVARRMLINGIKLPDAINIAGKKPWEVNFIDTLDLWKFGDYKHYTSLNLLTNIFGIPSPKDDIDGSEVAKVFYEENDIDRIARYCEKDVLATAQLFLRFKGEELIDPEKVERA